MGNLHYWSLDILTILGNHIPWEVRVKYFDIWELGPEFFIHNNTEDSNHLLSSTSWATTSHCVFNQQDQFFAHTWKGILLSHFYMEEGETKS